MNQTRVDDIFCRITYIHMYNIIGFSMIHAMLETTYVIFQRLRGCYSKALNK